MSENFHASFFDRSRRYQLGLVERLADDPEALLDGARERFVAMGPTLAYGDREGDTKDHPMAASLLSCASLLAIYLELKAEREHGKNPLDVHEFGAALLVNMKAAIEAARQKAEAGDQPVDDASKRLDALIEAGRASQESAQPGEFVFEAEREPGSENWRMKITSCGICALFSQYDAMDLVPYMCATDDLMSDLGNQGLSRTGTIALGKSHCDFHYQPGRKAPPLSSLYPERIRVLNS